MRPGEVSTLVEITRHDIDTRFKALTADFYAQMVFLMKGAVLAVAATSLLAILQSTFRPELISRPPGA